VTEPKEIVFEKQEIERFFINAIIQAELEQRSKKSTKRKKAIILAGPTGCGKSALGMILAKLIGGEIISADSMQVYRGMDIGTAKPSKEEMLEVPHHLIDIRDVSECFNVVDFYYEVKRCLQEITDRDSIPVIIGGSGFYIHALLYGPPSGPPSVPSLRKVLEQEMAEKGADGLYEKLKLFDEEYAKTISIHDKHKIIRALEIIELTGQKVSKLSWRERVCPLDYDFRCWFLHRPRSSLYRRIEKRCEKMVKQGLVEEVKGLENKGIRENPSAFQAIGYRQTLEYLESKQADADFQEYLLKFKKASRNYAKRQFTWFRRETIFRWLDLDLHDPETAVDIILTDLDRR